MLSKVVALTTLPVISPPIQDEAIYQSSSPDMVSESDRGRGGLEGYYSVWVPSTTTRGAQNPESGTCRSAFSANSWIATH